MNELEQNVEAKEQVTASKNEPKKKKGKIIAIIILLLIAIAIGLFYGYQKITTNPLSIYKKAINDTYELADNYLKENLDRSFSINPLTEAFNINADFTVNSNISELSALNNYQYSIAVGLDYPNNTMNVGLGLNNESEEIIEVLLSFLNDHAYLQSADLFDQVLDLGSANLNLDLDALNMNDNLIIDYDNLHVILVNMKNIIINSLDQDKFSVTDETISVNNESIDCRKFSYFLDEENYIRTMNYIKEQMSQNEELLSALANITGTTTDDLKTLLAEDVDTDSFSDITINLYAEGMEIKAGNMIINDEAIISFTNHDEQFSMHIGDEYTNIILTYEENTLLVSYNEYEEEVFALSLTVNNDHETLEIRTNDYGDEYTFNIEVSNIEETSNNFQTDFILGFNMNSYGTEMDIELQGTMNIEKGTLDTINPENSVDINSLSEEEQLTITENLYNILDRLGLSEYSDSL